MSRLEHVLQVGVHFKRPREDDAPEPRKTYKWRGEQLDEPPLVEDAAYEEDVKDCPVKYMCLDVDGPKRFKETRDRWVREKRAQRAEMEKPRETFKWHGYEMDEPPLVEDAAYEEDVADFPHPYTSMDAEGPKRRKEAQDRWVRNKRRQRGEETERPRYRPLQPAEAEGPRYRYRSLVADPRPLP